MTRRSLRILSLPLLVMMIAACTSGSFATPPRPKLSRCALCVASVNPESYHQSCNQLTMKKRLNNWNCILLIDARSRGQR